MFTKALEVLLCGGGGEVVERGHGQGHHREVLIELIKG